MSPTKNVLVIMGSIRAGRRCPQLAQWVIEIAQPISDLNYELIDLADFPLPMDDEPAIPAAGPQYAQPHSLAWSTKVAAADAVIFVTPQYNWGYPAPLKNALDHLYHEWKEKPAVIVTYGGHGGGKCATQLRQVVEAIGMKPTPTMPGITLTRAMIEHGAPMDPAKDFKSVSPQIRQAIEELATALAT